MNKREFVLQYQRIGFWPFKTQAPVYLEDPGARQCRYCGRGVSATSFANKAHAIPEFLGNKSLLVKYECDRCNANMARDYDSHLGARTTFARTLAQTRGKKGVPTFKDGQLRISASVQGLQFEIQDSQLAADLRRQLETGSKSLQPFAIDLEATTQPFVPLRAAQALIRIACSVCPHDERAACKPAIDWLMGRRIWSLSPLPVLSAFLPGPVTGVGSVELLKRISDEPIPYMWCLVCTGNWRFQVFVPGCPQDSSWMQPGTFPLDATHFPFETSAFGEPELSHGDWSGADSKSVSIRTALNVNLATLLEPRTDT